jgi:hypothetical protein
MKKIVVILVLFSVLVRLEAVEPSNSPSVGTMALNAWVWGMVGFAALDYFNDYKSASEEGLFIAAGFDPKMAYKEKAFDGVFRAGITFNRNEIYIGNEIFTAIDYFSTNVGYDRIVFDRKLSLLTGVEYTWINRPGRGYYHSFGGNITFRYKVNSRRSGELRSNLKSRPDISKPYIFSNYINVYFKF